VPEARVNIEYTSGEEQQEEFCERDLLIWADHLLTP
jgi:hypothetical protein